MSDPKWLNDDRKKTIIKLFNECKNVCFYGHENCPIENHYVQHKSVRLPVITGKDVPCKLPDGTLLKDRFGNIADKHVMSLKYKTIEYDVVQYQELDGCEVFIDRFDIQSDNLKQSWISRDKSDRYYAYQAEYDSRHNVKDRLPLKGTFNGIAKDVYYDQSPCYRVESIGISPIDFKPFVKIRIIASNDHLYVDLTDSLKGLSKNKKHKILRLNNNGLPDQAILDACNKAVKDYYSH